MPKEKSRGRYRETHATMARAYDDAVRDILRCEGRFNLDDGCGDSVWEWDGATWTRVPLVENHEEQAPFIDVDREGDVAAAR